MSLSHKTSNAQIFRLMVYRRALHPELFDLQGRRLYRKDDYETESWILASGHVVRIQSDKCVLTETLIDNGDHLPEMGLVYAVPCLGEKEFELEREDSDKLGYFTTVQTESLTDNLYLATFREMRDYVDESNALAHEWLDEDGTPCLSMVDTQGFRQEFHLQSYHLLGSSGMILRTQSIFEVR